MSDEMKVCPNCECPYGYFLRDEIYACPECNNEWNPSEIIEEDTMIVKDSNGNLLQGGDSVIVI